MQKGKVRKSQLLAIVAAFAALNVVADSFTSIPEFPSGVWYSWNFLVEPLTGIVLGPLSGFAAALVGVMVGHYVYFIDAYEFLFTIGAPIGATVSALMFRGRWKPVLAYYAALLTAYFVTPVAWKLPLWGMWDTYLAFALLVLTVLLIEKGLWSQRFGGLQLNIAVAAFVGLEADVLFRIFVFVPGQTYRLFYGFDLETLRLVWVSGAFFTPLKAALSTIATLTVGHQLIKVLRRTGFFTNH